MIAYYEYQQYQTNTYVSLLEDINTKITERNTMKQDLTFYIRTPAYQSFVAKATQNKKLPWEEVTNIIDEENLIANENINVNEVISTIQKIETSPTKDMTNPEKWKYIFENFREYL